MTGHRIVVTDEVCPRCTCGYSPSASPGQNMESLWRNAITHVDSWCQCGHHGGDHTGNYNGSQACDHCPCPRYTPITAVRRAGRWDEMENKHG